MYTIGQAAIRSGVSVPLLRAWERRYGVVRPERTASGYRLYDEASIARLRAMRVLVDAGWSPSQAARHIEVEGVPPSMAAPSEPESTSSTAESFPRPPDRGQAADFVGSAAAMDETRVESILDDILASGSFERAVDDRLMPALRALGEAWAAGEVSVAAEHAASHAVLRRLSAAFEAAGTGAVGRPVLVGLPPGSRHELAALAFATAVRRRGVGVVYLGPDVPLQSWVDAVRRTKAQAIVIGAPTTNDLGPAQEVARVGLALDGVLVAIGGAAATIVAIDDVLRLPDGIGPAAKMFTDALAVPGGRSSRDRRRR
jgi:MerR family transcriptional regulator, light-induced transcriptional regulator